MSMIQHEIGQLNSLKAFIVMKCNESVTCKEVRRSLQIIDSVTETIKGLSAKLHAVNMERSKIYYKGYESRENWIPCSERLPEDATPVKVTVLDSDWVSDYDTDWVPEEEKTRYPEERWVSAGTLEGSYWFVVDREVPGSFLVVERDGPEPVPGKLYSKVLAWMPLSGLYDGPE